MLYVCTLVAAVVMKYTLLFVFSSVAVGRQCSGQACHSLVLWLQLIHAADRTPAAERSGEQWFLDTVPLLE